MSEFIGLAYYAEVPAVIFDVQRTGPVDRHADAHAAGRPAAVRLRVARRHEAHLPLPVRSGGSASSWRSTAFDLAERFQTPVFVLSDLDIGMNDWMCRSSPGTTAYRPDRGKVLVGRASSSRPRSSTATSTSTATASPRARCPACIRRARTSRAARATTSSARYTEDADEYQEVIDRLARKIQNARRRPCRRRSSRAAPGATIGLVTVGGCHAAVLEAIDLLAKDGIAARLHARARLPVRRRRCAAFLDAARGRRSSSSRTATRSCAAC